MKHLLFAAALAGMPMHPQISDSHSVVCEDVLIPELLSLRDVAREDETLDAILVPGEGSEFMYWEAFGDTQIKLYGRVTWHNQKFTPLISHMEYLLPGERMVQPDDGRIIIAKPSGISYLVGECAQIARDDMKQATVEIATDAPFRYSWKNYVKDLK